MRQNGPPIVSVVMSVYNGERYLCDAIESICQQTFRDFEFIIVDDGSTDNTKGILEKYVQKDRRILLSQNERNVGLTRSLNKGLTVARGEYIARQDADDVSLPERLATQVAYLRGHAEIGLLGTAYYLVDFQGKCIGQAQPPLSDSGIRWRLLFHNAFCHTSVMFNRKLTRDVGLFYNEDLLFSQDYDLWTRMLEHTSGANLETPLVCLRVHQSSITSLRRGEQDRIAFAVAAKQIRSLYPRPTIRDSELHILRRWYEKLPVNPSRDDMALCGLLLQILNTFGQQENIDPMTVRDLRRHWINRILACISVKQLSDLWSSDLLPSMLRDDALSVMNHISKRAVKRIGPFLDRTGRGENRRSFYDKGKNLASTVARLTKS